MPEPTTHNIQFLLYLMSTERYVDYGMVQSCSSTPASISASFRQYGPILILTGKLETVDEYS